MVRGGSRKRGKFEINSQQRLLVNRPLGYASKLVSLAAWWIVSVNIGWEMPNGGVAYHTITNTRIHTHTHNGLEPELVGRKSRKQARFLLCAISSWLLCSGLASGLVFWSASTGITPHSASCVCTHPLFRVLVHRPSHLSSRSTLILTCLPFLASRLHHGLFLRSSQAD
ncbi:hypothetical protein LZ32DRAFT_190455 [Colletotrichum eremochloae]|nr:hypothetical protein LZ32DRAFT_190455 [Colletotrichum eremochloae]